MKNSPACRNCGNPIPCPINARRALRRGYGYCGHRCAAPKPRPLLDRFLERVSPEPNTGCWIWTGTIHPRDGYGNIGSGGATATTNKTLKSHRVAYEFFRGSIPTGFVVCHTCDNRWCVNPDHLFLGTVADNLRDMRRKDRHTRGERTPWAKLTDAQVRAILCKSGSHNSIARQFGVSAGIIARIRKRQIWKHVDPDQLLKETEAAA